MKLRFKNIKQEIFEFEIFNENEIKIIDVKKLLESKYGFDSTKIKILSNSMILEDSKYLKDYSINETSTLILANLKKKIQIEDPTNISNIESHSEEKLEENICENSQIEIKNEISLQQENSNQNEEKVYTAEVKAKDAVKYVASIMKMLCLKKPEKGKEFFKNLEQDNPEIMYLIKKNEAEFKQLLYAPKTEEDEINYKNFKKCKVKNNEVKSKDDNNYEIETIKKLEEYGFPYDMAKDAYFQNGKNFESALNYLLNMYNN